MSQITPQIYVGGIQEASSKEWLESHGISHILNAAMEVDIFFPDDYKYLHLQLNDVPGQNLYPSFEKAYKFILDGIERGGTVLVHCFAGISRSVSMLSYFLMKSDQRTFAEVLKFIQSRRPIANPNPGFAFQLVSVSPQIKEVLQLR